MAKLSRGRPYHPIRFHHDQAPEVGPFGSDELTHRGRGAGREDLSRQFKQGYQLCADFAYGNNGKGGYQEDTESMKTNHRRIRGNASRESTLQKLDPESFDIVTSNALFPRIETDDWWRMLHSKLRPGGIFFMIWNSQGWN